jgi:hypothetical protein
MENSRGVVIAVRGGDLRGMREAPARGVARSRG